MTDDKRETNVSDYGDFSTREKMLHLACIIRRAALIRPLGPNSKAIHDAGGTVMLTPAESEAAADAVLNSDWLKAHDDALRERLAQEVEALLDENRYVGSVRANRYRDTALADAARIVRGGDR
jgi:hypothetical protein